MGRYFQTAFWPFADFELGAFIAAVPDSLVQFHSSGGVHLIAWHFIANNGTLATARISGAGRLDGGAVSGLDAGADVGAGLILTIGTLLLLEIAQGNHTLELFATGVAAAGDVVIAGSGYLSAVELPQWETSDRIVGG